MEKTVTTSDEDFNKLVIDELKTLASDIEHGLTPSNICLMEVVTKELMEQERRR
jgi:hypothetical protein